MLYQLRPRGRTFDTEQWFPPLPDDKIVLTTLSGGMESTLIGRLALDHYGPERVHFVVFDTLFSRNIPIQAEVVLANFHRAFETLGGKHWHQLSFDYDLHLNDRKASLVNVKNYLEQNFSQAEALYFGFTKLFFDVEPLNCMVDPSVQKIRDACNADPVRFERVIEEFHVNWFDDYVKLLMHMKIVPEVYDFLRNTPNLRIPFGHLDKAEIIDLYLQLGYEELLYQTWSCTTHYTLVDEIHCGKCFNCQERVDGHRQLGIPDLTKYRYDTVFKIF